MSRVALALPAVVRVDAAKAKPARFRLQKGFCVVGAGSKADVIVADPEVSRRHVQLSLVPEGVQVEDLGSRNGTFYLGQRVERMTLALGSRLRIGSTEIALEVDPEALVTGEGDEPTAYRGLAGGSAAMRKLFARLTRLEGSLVNVLIEGESGVGKELIASALHQGSALAAETLVTLNCGALPRELIASELFGHKKGAFTGAVDARSGAFERADGGTLFLDEIGELPLDVQPMLLRALESGEVTPVGGDAPKRVKVRVIAATNRDLSDEVNGGRFREDLFFRLAVVTLVIPPLRERSDDVALLASAFARAEGMGPLDDDVLAELASRPWPGNVRELKNAIRAYAALGDLPDERRAQLRAGDDLDRALAKLVDPSRPYAEQKDEIAARFSRIYLELVLRKTGGNQTEAARIAGLDRGYLGKLLNKHGVGKR
jgi:two-component system, NtrC family, response regulator GlrR